MILIISFTLVCVGASLAQQQLLPTTVNFLGPFPVGKTEVIGDPVEDFGGVANAWRLNDGEQQYSSELVSGGFVKWERLRPGRSGYYDISAHVQKKTDWSGLIQGLSSTDVLEFAGWMVADLHVPRGGRYALGCEGATAVWLDLQSGVVGPLVGDPYHTGAVRTGVTLSAGQHTLYVHARSTASAGRFRCRAVGPLVDLHSSWALFSSSADAHPDIVGGLLRGRRSWVQLAVRNDGVEPLFVAVSPLGAKHEIQVSSETRQVAAGQISALRIELRWVAASSLSPSRCPLRLELRVRASISADFPEGATSERTTTLALECRALTQSWIFTFIDVDGSVSHAAAIAPRDCSSETPKAPVLLTLHGTSISARDSADAFKHKRRGAKPSEPYVFGAAGYWVLAPTRHGAHNWENLGLASALAALRALAELSAQAGWNFPAADETRVLVSGHSMGAHGAWLLAQRLSSQTIGLAAHAGWSRKELYGGSNTLPGASPGGVSQATPALAPELLAVLAQAVQDGAADYGAPSLGGIPVLARTGALDRTVHPYHTRRLARLAEANGANVTFVELPGKEHWWWDTLYSNDGGAINDDACRRFFADALAAATPAWPSLPTSFRAVFNNPASWGGRAGVRALQLTRPFRHASVEYELARAGGGELRLRTQNVRRLGPSAGGMALEEVASTLYVDGDGPFEPHGFRCLERGAAAQAWRTCADAEAREAGGARLPARGPLTSGPLRRANEAPITIVVGTAGTSAGLRAAHWESALFLANSHYATSNNGDVRVVTDTEALAAPSALTGRAVWAIGSAASNSWLAEEWDALEEGGFGVRALSGGGFAIGRCAFSEPRHGAVFSAPLPGGAGGRMGVVLLGNSAEALRAAAHLGRPTIPPMARSPFANLFPDYVAFDAAEVARVGVAGYMMAGYWGNNWEHLDGGAEVVCPSLPKVMPLAASCTLNVSTGV